MDEVRNAFRVDEGPKVLWHKQAHLKGWMELLKESGVPEWISEPGLILAQYIDRLRDFVHENVKLEKVSNKANAKLNLSILLQARLAQKLPEEALLLVRFIMSRSRRCFEARNGIDPLMWFSKSFPKETSQEIGPFCIDSQFDIAGLIGYVRPGGKVHGITPVKYYTRILQDRSMLAREGVRSLFTDWTTGLPDNKKELAFPISMATHLVLSQKGRCKLPRGPPDETGLRPLLQDFDEEARRSITLNQHIGELFNDEIRSREVMSKLDLGQVGRIMKAVAEQLAQLSGTVEDIDEELNMEGMYLDDFLLVLSDRGLAMKEHWDRVDAEREAEKLEAEKTKVGSAQAGKTKTKKTKAGKVKA